ncbi:PP2C family serine/threonine-protein phosphatase [Ruegeria sp. Ofav3-42]|uniref:PP2C family protein-serine/threonine phosphatase n=1 Tax=Ruegeria sp. Ofav3-42 TaxID=2917759 RepID=UPI001EF687B2|nr:protein phosphatase 2C domain-containing protein [Ruegeria sp. Ofav3-42]MCG7522558.1 protein phosphatase 2C domain-containing protein [Ruegeria sp. Ofav3-42]
MTVPYRFEFSEPTGHLVLVADGLGGHRAGEYASETVANTFLSLRPRLKGSYELVEFLRSANRTLYELGAGNSLLEGMGTTVAGVVCLSERLIWFNVGDSKVFRFHNSVLHQLSVDDFASETHIPSLAKPALSQSLGGTPNFHDIDPHTGIEQPSNGSKYLICSDGLTDVVPIPYIEQSMSHSNETAVGRLLDATLAQGAPDNVSIIVMSVETSAPQKHEHSSR